ncbi:orotate phosphoribosyltransferase [Candidatus Epulonipiscium fishelsonii]|uniref:Orotate phosphoribosyltransferase n=1 Tax=Candidatus Epulonipiscium fishelsonii TaxID=77094 RepID=A0ACC8XAT6_9FIRM|nr:orotate phosphoribosyltransferase [Epulopiscium sp. SCG-B05WGA-EpuloA1]ONI39467.1 orotate phosphoribosyltransferase [Epulopiscium sp. SCG-B11WGA-EpuloA1]
MYKQEFIKFMVKSNVLTFGDFITKSGRQTPYFINTGNYQTGEQIAKLGTFYAKCIKENINQDVDALFGPAYKGIPLAITTAISLANEYNQNVNYCFNRKEEKDHGEGGSLVGYKLKDGDKILIIEDVITAGTEIRECVPNLKKIANIEIVGLVISVDRMEKGVQDKTAINEIYDKFGIKTCPIVTVKDIIETLHNKEVDGKVIINDELKYKMENYMNKYCVI